MIIVTESEASITHAVRLLPAAPASLWWRPRPWPNSYLLHCDPGHCHLGCCVCVCVWEDGLLQRSVQVHIWTHGSALVCVIFFFWWLGIMSDCLFFNIHTSPCLSSPPVWSLSAVSRSPCRMFIGSYFTVALVTVFKIDGCLAPFSFFFFWMISKGDVASFAFPLTVVLQFHPWHTLQTGVGWGQIASSARVFPHISKCSKPNCWSRLIKH